MKHVEFDNKYSFLTNDDSRTNPKLSTPDNLKDLLKALQETGDIFGLNAEPINIHDAAYNVTTYIRFLLSPPK